MFQCWSDYTCPQHRIYSSDTCHNIIWEAFEEEAADEEDEKEIVVDLYVRLLGLFLHIIQSKAIKYVQVKLVF